MSKKELIKSKSVKNVFRERIILGQINHPYIVGLKFAFQDEEYAFFVMDYVQGGDLKAVLKKLGTVPTHVCQYMIAQLGSALDHIHLNEIVHRYNFN